MTSRARLPDEAFVDYRINLRKEAADLKQRLKGWWHHISIQFELVPTLNKETKIAMVDSITNKPLKHMIVASRETYTNPKRAEIKADRGARRHHNHFNKPAQVHNHG